MEAKALHIYPKMTDRRPSQSFQYKNYRKLVVSTMEGRQVISFDRILYIVSASNYCTLVLKDQKITLSKTLKWVQDQLDCTFLRVHNSYLVSLLQIDSYNHKDSVIRLNSAAVIPVSRSRRQQLLSTLTT